MHSKIRIFLFFLLITTAGANTRWQKHFVVWNPDPTPAPGYIMYQFLDSLGYVGDYSAMFPDSLSQYLAVFVCAGIYPNNYIIGDSSPEAESLVNFLNSDGRMYLEGDDVWYFDPLYAGGYDFGPLFGLRGYGGSLQGSLHGVPGTFTEGMDYFIYGGENPHVLVAPAGTGFLIFRTSAEDSVGVANDSAGYRTVGMVLELGLLIDSTPPSTRMTLLDSIMHFFLGGTGIGATNLTTVRQPMELHVHPNPFTTRTEITFSLSRESEKGKMAIYDALGRCVRDLMVDRFREIILWDGRDNAGCKLPNGVYFVRLQDNNSIQTTSIILSR